ncbi:MAG: Tfp pilus assembly protein FimT/FimU [Phycisphaerae bacterium]
MYREANTRQSATELCLKRRNTLAPPEARRGRGGRAFTLVEMLVVMAIVVIALTLVLPSAQKMWEQRKIADAENTMRGLLMTARAKSLSASGPEGGLLFYIDEDGAQQVVSIEQDEQGRWNCKSTCYAELGVDCDNSCDSAWEDVFRVTEDRMQRFPRPMRAVPRYVVDSAEGNTPEVFSDAEVGNEVFDPPASSQVDIDEAQRHRNYFTMIYANDGRLLVGRDVLIRDDDGDGDKLGDLTGLSVGYNYAAGTPSVKQYYRQDNSKDFMDHRQHRAVPFLVVDRDDRDDEGNPVAINFPSIDGVLVYDDSLLAGLESDQDKRNVLMERSRPFYVNRMTGAVIRGPREEIAQ